MSKFTPGEWKHNAKVGDIYAVIGTGEVFPIAYVNNARNFMPEFVAEHESELKANARLITAAPEMYGELYEALPLLKGKSSYEGDEFDVQAKSIEDLLVRIDEEVDYE